MNFKLLLQSNFIIFIYINVIQSQQNHRNILPWFIKGNSIYYIETRPNFTAAESYAECAAKKMTAIIEEYDAYDLQALTQLYENLPKFWIINNDKSISFGENSKNGPYSLRRNPADCFRVDAYESSMIAENCSNSMGFICRAFYYGAIAFYKNGTSSGVSHHEMGTICDPHSNAYDETLQLCMLVLSREFLS